MHNTDEVRWNTQTMFGKRSKRNGKVFWASKSSNHRSSEALHDDTTVNPTTCDTGSGHIAKARCCVHGVQGPRCTRRRTQLFLAARSCSNRGSHDIRRKLNPKRESMRVHREPLYAKPVLEGSNSVPDCALTRLDPEV